MIVTVGIIKCLYSRYNQTHSINTLFGQCIADMITGNSFGLLSKYRTHKGLRIINSCQTCMSEFGPALKARGARVR